MPTDEDDDAPHYSVTTGDIKMVSDYAHLSFNEAIQLDCFTYKVLLRDAFIDKLNQTEEGREYLESCWYLEQTKPDRESLRKRFKED